MNEEQMNNFLAKVLGTFQTLCERFEFHNSQYEAQNRLFCMRKYFEYQASHYSFSFRDTTGALRLLHTFSSWTLNSAYVHSKANKLILFFCDLADIELFYLFGVSLNRL